MLREKGERREAIYSQETRCVVDSGSTEASAEGQERQRGRTRERERRKDKCVTLRLSGAILDWQGGCLNTSESLLSNRV